MRVEMNHADEEVRGVFGGGCGVRLAFDERRNFEWAVSFSGRPVPRALVSDFAIALFPRGDELRGVFEREDGAGDDGNVSASDDFEHAESVGDVLVAPAVAGDDGDAEDLRLRGLDEREDGLQVGGGGAEGVFVDDDFGLLLGGRGQREQIHGGKKQQKVSANHGEDSTTVSVMSDEWRARVKTSRTTQRE